MKTKLFALLLAVSSCSLLAQTPPAPARPTVPGAPVNPAAPAAPATGANPGGANPTQLPSLNRTRLPRYTSTANQPAATPATTAAPADSQNDELIPQGMIDLTSADVSQVLDIYAKLVNRTILHGQLPDAKIVLKTQTQLTRGEAIQALQAMLALNNISVINIGDKFVKAVPSDQANVAGAELDQSGSTNLPNMGSYVTHVAQLRYVKPSVMIPFIQPFAKLQGGLLGIDDNGILVMRDYAENIKRMLEMIERIDISTPTEYVSEVIPIRYAKVDEIASALNSLGGGGGGTSVSIGQGASSGQISGLSGSRSGGISGLGGMSSGMSSGMGGYGSGSSGAFGRTTGTSFGSTGSTPNGTPNTGSTFQQRLQNIINRAGGSTTSGGGSGSGGQQDIQLFGTTKIIPNESSSTLLIYATRQDMDQIKEIISKLDVPLAQVLIEAVIMDVTIGNTFNLGVSASQNPHSISSAAGGIVGGGGMNNGQSFMQFVQTLTTNRDSSGNITSIASSYAASGATNSVFGSSLPGGLSYFGNIGPNYDLAVTAAESDSHASIIQ
ncbi:MAG TPA: secretin N-terminal domain-containing protein, partial [Verrucomicrobiae bacterium]